jgi:hypothetical protein
MTPAGRAAKERKQKIFVAVGGLILLAILAIQLPKILGGSSEPAATSTPTTVGTVTGGTTPVITPAAVVSSDGAPAPGAGQLSSFSEFRGKDPFVQQVAASGGVTAVAGDVGNSPPASPSTPAGTKGFTVGGPSSAVAVTVISVNGARQALGPGTVFPASDPVFVLVAENPKSKTVTIGIAGGAYASGSKVTKLVAGKPLVLVNTTTGARYKLVLVAVGNGTVPSGTTAPPTAPTTPTTPASTP